MTQKRNSLIENLLVLMLQEDWLKTEIDDLTVQIMEGKTRMEEVSTQLEDAYQKISAFEAEVAALEVVLTFLC